MSAETVRTVARKLAAMRAIQRPAQPGWCLGGSLPASVGASAADLEDLYRLLAIAKYEDRTSIPPAHAEDAGALTSQHEQRPCSLAGPPALRVLHAGYFTLVMASAIVLIAMRSHHAYAVSVFLPWSPASRTPCRGGDRADHRLS